MIMIVVNQLECRIPVSCRILHSNHSYLSIACFARAILIIITIIITLMITMIIGIIMIKMFIFLHCMFARDFLQHLQLCDPFISWALKCKSFLLTSFTKNSWIWIKIFLNLSFCRKLVSDGSGSANTKSQRLPCQSLWSTTRTSSGITLPVRN